MTLRSDGRPCGVPDSVRSENAWPNSIYSSARRPKVLSKPHSIRCSNVFRPPPIPLSAMLVLEFTGELQERREQLTDASVVIHRSAQKTI
jgi:hypothetical protein